MQNSTQAANAWRILFLLFLANLFNFFDRTIPAIIIEPIRMEWHLSDFQLGIIGTAFTIVYAIAGLPLGRLADTGSRSKLMGWGLAAWSGLTAVNGLVGSFWTFLLVRMGIGIGEASYAPAANSLIGDLFPAHRRARAMGIFMLGLPLGLLLAFFTIGAMVKAFDSWRAPFFIAAVPGLILAVFMFYIKEPKRGAAEAVQVSQEKVDRPIRRVLAVPTFLWLVLAGLCFNFATYACNSFLVPMLQRYFLLPLQDAAVATGVIVGITGLVGLTLGGWIADKIHQRIANGRLLFAACSLIISGQIPLLDGKPTYIGRLGESISEDEGAKAAELAALGLLAQLSDALGDDLSRLVRIIRLGVFIASSGDFQRQGAVANGASNLLVNALGDKGRHARTAVGVASLPGGVAVEIDAIFELQP